MRVRLRSVGAAFGAEVLDVDLSGRTTAPLRAQLTRALRSYGLLVFRDQALNGIGFCRVGRWFGRLERYAQGAGGETSAVVVTSSLDSSLDGRGQSSTARAPRDGTFYWHSDRSYMPVPTAVTLLQPLVLPSPSGTGRPTQGGTEFADARRAFVALPERERRELRPLRVLHSQERIREMMGLPPRAADDPARAPAAHPLVCACPSTGEEFLYLGMYCSHVEGLSESDGRSLLDRLESHVTSPDFVYRHQWRLGDVAVWDNRALLHRAIADYDGTREARVMRRVCVAGDGGPVANKASEPGAARRAK